MIVSTKTGAKNRQMTNPPLCSAEWNHLITQGAKAFDMHLGQKEADQFAFHALELLKWNCKMNLTAITDPLDVAVKHFLDSVAPASLIPSGASLLDIGSGGGFPGIPLKITRPSVSVTLIDSSRKKVSFQKHIIRSLGLQDIEAMHIRAEDLARDPGYANAFDVIVCRALSALDSFVRMASPLLAKGGVMIALKGRLSRAEIESARSHISEVLKTSKILTVKRYVLPYLESERSIVCVNWT